MSVLPLKKQVYPTALYTCEQIKELESIAFEKSGLSAEVLMKRAGRAAFELGTTLWPEATELVVMCGSANNAGDGYVVAALAAQKKMSVKVVALVDPSSLTGAAKQAYEFAIQENVEFASLSEFLGMKLNSSTLVFDAVLGTGISREIEGEFGQAINYVNKSCAQVLGIDIPTGINGDTGAVMGNAVQCDATITFIGVKKGMLTSRAPAFSGDVYLDVLGLNDDVFNHPKAPKPSTHRVSLPVIKSDEPYFSYKRQADAHKGDFGHVLVVGGDKGMGGAAILAAESALRSGAGRVSVATQSEHISAILTRSPEIMAASVSGGQHIPPLISSRTVLCVGPGLGQSAWSEQLLQAATLSGKPMVLDADGLNILANRRVVRQAKRENWVLTPHPGEAARLLKTSIADIQKNRFQAVRELQAKYGGVVVLKGAGTVIASGEEVVVAHVGHPAMAAAGMGDVLSGIVASLIAQGVSLFQASVIGVCIHGQAGELAASEIGEIGVQAGDLTKLLPRVINA